jgi:hypothetical protein
MQRVVEALATKVPTSARTASVTIGRRNTGKWYWGVSWSEECGSVATNPQRADHGMAVVSAFSQAHDALKREIIKAIEETASAADNDDIAGGLRTAAIIVEASTLEGAYSAVGGES